MYLDPPFFLYFHLSLFQDVDINYCSFSFPLLDSIKILNIQSALFTSDIPGKVPGRIESSYVFIFENPSISKEATNRSGHTLPLFSRPLFWHTHLDLSQNHLYFKKSILHLLPTSFTQLKRLMPLPCSFFCLP